MENTSTRGQTSHLGSITKPFPHLRVWLQTRRAPGACEHAAADRRSFGVENGPKR